MAHDGGPIDRADFAVEPFDAILVHAQASKMFDARDIGPYPPGGGPLQRITDP